MLTAIGRVYLQQGAFRESLSWLDNAVRLSETVDANPSRALALYHRGIAFESLGDHAKALELFAEALAIKERLGDRRQQAWILGHIGDAHAALRNQQAALDAYRRSLRISEDIGDPRGVASGLSKVASMSLELGDSEGSLASFKRSSRLFSDNQPAFAATAVSGMARAHAAAGQAQAALDQGAAPWRWREAAPTTCGGPHCVRSARSSDGLDIVTWRWYTCARVSPSSSRCASVSFRRPMSAPVFSKANKRCTPRPWNYSLSSAERTKRSKLRRGRAPAPSWTCCRRATPSARRHSRLRRCGARSSAARRRSSNSSRRQIASSHGWCSLTERSRRSRRRSRGSS